MPRGRSGSLPLRVGLRVVRCIVSSEAVFEKLAEQWFRQLATNKDDSAFLVGTFRPLAREIKPGHHVHALKHHAARLALDVEDALVAQHLLAIEVDQRTDVAIHLTHVERLFALDDKTVHFVVVLMIVTGQEIRLDFKNGIQIEAANVQQLLNRCLAEVNLLDGSAHVELAQALHELLRFFLGCDVCL